jgi:hypothetical protein
VKISPCRRLTESDLLLLEKPLRPFNTSSLANDVQCDVQEDDAIRILTLPQVRNRRVLLTNDIRIVPAFAKLGDYRRFPRATSSDDRDPWHSKLLSYQVIP